VDRGVVNGRQCVQAIAEVTSASANDFSFSVENKDRVLAEKKRKALISERPYREKILSYTRDVDNCFLYSFIEVQGDSASTGGGKRLTPGRFDYTTGVAFLEIGES
jgi:hypothetical protein